MHGADTSPPQPARPRGRRYPRAWSRLRPQSRQSPRQACYLSAWSNLHENHPTQKPEARYSSAWTTSPHTGKPLSDIFEAPPGTAPAHGEPFLRVFPAHPAAGVTSYTENPSQGATPNTGHWQPPRMQKITPIYSRFLRPPRTRSPLFTHLPGSPCGGCNLVPGDPLSGGHTKCRPLEHPHTRGKAASVCAGRR